MVNQKFYKAEMESSDWLNALHSLLLIAYSAGQRVFT